MKIRDEFALMNGTTDEIFETDNGIDILDDNGKTLYTVSINENNELRINGTHWLNIKPIAGNAILIKIEI